MLANVADDPTFILRLLLVARREFMNITAQQSSEWRAKMIQNRKNHVKVYQKSR